MNESLDTFFENDEGPVVDDADDLSFDSFTDRVLFGDQDPGIFESLFVTQRDPFALTIETKYHDVDLVTDIEVLGWVAHPTPRNIGDVEETVETSEINKDSVIGQILDNAFDQFSFLEGGHGLFFDLALLLLEDRLARQHDVRTPAVEGDDPCLDLLLEIVLEPPVGE